MRWLLSFSRAREGAHRAGQPRHAGGRQLLAVVEVDRDGANTYGSTREGPIMTSTVATLDAPMTSETI